LCGQFPGVGRQSRLLVNNRGEVQADVHRLKIICPLGSIWLVPSAMPVGVPL
jgi:hypothetical protein